MPTLPPSPSAAPRNEPALEAPALPEITVKALFLGIVLSMVLAGANAYLGLLAGMTVSASIPAAVVSMALLRLFRRSNILENNIVQTAASAGESLAAGVIFTIPALVLLGTWARFDYWQTTMIAGLGGLLGVLFTVPLRRALIVEAKLKFPEGVATAEVLRVGDRAGTGARHLALGGVVGALAKLGEAGLGLWRDVADVAWRVGGSVLYLGTNVVPALVGVGYIVGVNIAVLVFLGGALNWYVAIPIIAAASNWPTAGGEPMAAAKWAGEIWRHQTRYIGVGAMIVGGLWAIIRLWPSLVRAVSSGLAAHRQAQGDRAESVPRTERDVPMRWVGLALAVSVVPLFFVFRHVTGDTGVAAFMAAVMLVAGFLFSAVASYMAGVVGSSNNPVSGVTIATILISALLLAALGTGSATGPAAAILIGAVVCCAAAIGGDNLQDLKTGHLVGATPWKQQLMQAIGVVAAAFVVAPILNVLLDAYGIGPGTKLEAPQASLMKSVAEGVFARTLPWAMVAVGMGLAVGLIVLDVVLERRGSAFRTPVLAVAVGIYLPVRLGVAILAGGLVAWAVQRAVRRRSGSAPAAGGHGTGVLLAAGLITGEAILGILLAIPRALNEGRNPLALLPEELVPTWPGLVILAGVVALLYRSASKPQSATEAM